MGAEDSDSDSEAGGAASLLEGARAVGQTYTRRFRCSRANRAFIEEAAAAPRQLLTLIDCRTAAERAVSTLPGAVSREAFEANTTKNRREPPGSSSVLVPYCTIGYRSGMYADDLAKRFPRCAVRNGEGVLCWAHEGGELVDASGKPTCRIHTFGRRWADLVPPGYEAVTFANTPVALVHHLADELAHQWARRPAWLFLSNASPTTDPATTPKGGTHHES